MDDLQRFLDDNGVTRVRVQGVQPDALLVGKILRPAAFVSAIESGVSLADFAFGTDRAGDPGLGYSSEWRSTVVGDIHLVPDVATLRLAPGVEGMATCFADAVDVEYRPIPLCGRGLVRRLSDRLEGEGFQARFAFEIEGQFFTKSFQDNRTNRWRNLEPFGVGGHLPYLAQDLHRLDGVMTEICGRLEALGVPWEAWNAEGAAGQFELNLSPADPVTAADHVLLVRQVCKEVAYERDMSVTFMAKVTEDYGNGLHVHHSLVGDDGPVFFDDTDPANLAQIARWWLGGLMATLPGCVSLMAPNPNSFRRMAPFLAVPTHVTWDFDNKSTALRVLTRSASSARIEHRVGAGDLHPHFAVAVTLAGGLAGLEGRLEPPPPFAKMAWGLPTGEGRPDPLPASMPAAWEALDADANLRRHLGDDLVDYWIGMRRFEWLSFHTSGGDPDAEGPTPWELDRYFETL